MHVHYKSIYIRTCRQFSVNEYRLQIIETYFYQIKAAVSGRVRSRTQRESVQYSIRLFCLRIAELHIYLRHLHQNVWIYPILQICTVYVPTHM